MPKVRAFEIAPLPFEVSASLQALGHRIVTVRKSHRYSQRVFADMLGVAPATLVTEGVPQAEADRFAHTFDAARDLRAGTSP